MIIGLLVIVLALYFSHQLKKQSRKFQHYIQEQQLLIDSHQLDINLHIEQDQHNISKLQNQQIEHQQVSKQLEHRIKVIQQEISNLHTLIANSQAISPEDKLYTRASKLVSLGASLDEIMQECDIPLAEAQMLLSIHTKNTSTTP